jgi:peroxiredoxin
VSDALKATPESKWVHVELNTPQATSADALGSRDDLVVHKSGTILLQDGKESKFMQTGELVQIGRAWKLVDGPSIGGAATGPDMIPALPEGVRALVEALNKLDTAGPTPPITTASIAAHSAKRAELLEQIVAKLPPQEQEAWVKLLVDSLSSAAEGEKIDGKHISRLKQLKDSLAKGPNTNLAAYAIYHHMITENSIILIDVATGKMSEVQEQLRNNLDNFIKAYPNSAEAAEAMLRLAMAYEFLGTKDGETKAKEWYERLRTKADKNPHAAKAAGAILRMDSENKPLDLAGPKLDKPAVTFNASTLRGKVVVVYYCANWGRSLDEDTKKIRELVNKYGPKGLEVVTVSLDHNAETARQTVAGLPGTHLYEVGGLDNSPLAAKYGIIAVPHMFVVNKDGNIVNRSAQAMTVEDDVKKLLP